MPTNEPGNNRRNICALSLTLSQCCCCPVFISAGQYFTSTRAAVKFYPDWSSFQELYQRASLNSKSLADAFAGSAAYTYLLPTNAALKPAMQVLSKAGNADLVQLLEYHVVPQLRPVPTGWKDGETVKTTLEGRTLKAQLTQR